jgi:hypothetical protein
MSSTANLACSCWSGNGKTFVFNKIGCFIKKGNIYISLLTHQADIIFQQTNVCHHPEMLKVGDMTLQLRSSTGQKQICAPLHLISDIETSTINP